MDKYDTLEYSRIKAITVSVRLQNFLCALIKTNSYESGIADKSICSSDLLYLVFTFSTLF
jgi:hypothetical protein